MTESIPHIPASDYRSPVILFGHGRSGTSIVGGLMRDYLGVGFGTESQFIVSYYKRLKEFGPLDLDANLNNLIDQLLSERWFQRSHKYNAFRITRKQIQEQLPERTYSSVLDTIFTAFANGIGMQRWGDKTPAYIHNMNVIYELFPNAQFVYLIRDGRDVALSLRNIYFGPKNMYTAAHDWAATVRAGDQFAQTLPPHQLFQLTYEEFVQNPVDVFKRMAKFLGINSDLAVTYEVLERQMLSKVKLGNSDKWRKAFSQRQLIAYDSIAFNELHQHGYETTVDSPSRPSSRIEELYWSMLSEFGKWRFKGYWRDNYYKLRLRCRRMFRR